MVATIQENLIQTKYEALKPELNERTRRLWCAVEARSLGRGGVATVSRATGLAESTIRLGQRELAELVNSPSASQQQRIRKQGAGRKSLTHKDEEILKALDRLVEPTTRGDPMSPLRWTCKSTRRLAKELSHQGHKVSHTKVGQLLKELNYSLQAPRKTREGDSHPDRNQQFEYISERVKRFQQNGQPVVSVDTKKKELIGDFANSGREYQPQGSPEKVRMHDFVDKQLGKAIPYGVYDLTRNCAWVSVGIDHDTAEFAVATLQRWWQRMGQPMYSEARQLMITADSGGSNSSRSRLWKIELQHFSDSSGLELSVCHFPPGTSKWNKIEHRLFSHITENWRGRPLVSREVIVNLIANTTTETGLHVEAGLDLNSYPTGKTVSDDDISAVNLVPADFHGEDWNYLIKPRHKNR